MIEEKWLLTMLGFAAKARKAVAGKSNVEAALKKNEAELLIVAEDAANKEHWQKIAEEKNIKIITASKQLELGLAMGLSPRAIVVVKDRQMKEAILARK